MALEHDQTLGRYRILSRLGTGGMGEVYRALAVGPDGVEKPVAVKLVRDDLVRNEELTRLFLEEAKVSFVLTHPNVIQTYEMGQVDEHFFLVMELVDGTDAAEVLYYCTEQLNQPMPAPFALYIASRVARGLAYAHNLVDQQDRPLGIVHRDVSPGNVLISRDGQVKVADFGLAKSALRKMETRSGIKGKLGYMAPEQFQGQEVDARADVFSLGVMLYEMLSAQNPFGDLGEITVSRRASAGTFEQLATVAPHLDAGVVKLVDRCLALVPERRPAAEDLARQLDRLAQELGLVSSDYGLAEFIGRIHELRQTADQQPHPFDRVLGMELERVAGQEALSTFVAVPSSRPLATHETLIKAHPGDAPAGGTALLPAPGHSPLRRVVLAVALLLLGGAGLGLLWLWNDRGVARDPYAAGAGAAPGQLRDAEAARPRPGPDRSRPSVTATLQIRPTPAGGQVTVGGVPRGVAPLTLRELAAGRQVRVQITLAGREPYDRQVLLEPGATLVLQPRLRPLPATAPSRKKKRPRRPRPAGFGTLSVNSDPWSVVHIDGTRAGNTPLMRFRLSCGKHTVKLVNPGKKLSKQQVVMIRKDREYRLSVSLK